MTEIMMREDELLAAKRRSSSIGSVKGEIESLLKSSHTSLYPPSREFLECAYKKVVSFEEVSERMFWCSINNLDQEIREAVYKLGDALTRFSICPEDLGNLRQELRSFIETLNKMEACTEESDNLLPEEVEEEEDDVVSSRVDFVGLSDVYNTLQQRLTSPVGSHGVQVLSLVGMAGIGKTTLAKKVFQDEDIVKYYDCRVWVRVGRKCQFKEIRRSILAQVNPDSDQILAEGDEDTANKQLKESLRGKRYLIVLDDIWKKNMADHFRLPTSRPSWRFEKPLITIKEFNPSRPSWWFEKPLSTIKEFKLLFPDGENGSRILLTSRLQQVNNQWHVALPMRLLDKKESWDLFCENLFAKVSCPPQLEKAGKKIVENCDGLPLTIITVAGILSQAKKDPKYWSEVATQKNHELFMDAYDKISKVLLPSYKYLDSILRMCFLYMGVFPQKKEIIQSKVFNMWNADGFPELNVLKFPNPYAKLCFKELVANSLVMMQQNIMDGEQTKTCRLHSSFWYLSNKEARKTKFSLVLNSCNDGLGEAIQSQCRLSFHNNILFGIKGMHKLVEDNCASTAHSLLCYGPYHQYLVPICFGLRLLKVLDALTIRFYEFPLEVLQLVQLRYLSLTLNGELPTSISQLSDLQFLIIGRHMIIRSLGAPLCLPVEIWNLKELIHIQVMGSDLPEPCGASLESLSKLSDISADSCTETVLKAIPNLRKLGIRIELAPDDDDKVSLSCFDHVYHLKRLKSLKCVVVNPKLVPRLAPLSIFPEFLTKLSLSGLGYSWEEMSKLSSLPNLELLKLRNYAFRGPEWKVEEMGFPSLRSLVIEDTDLVEWKIGSGSFRCFEYLRMKNIYRLQKIHGNFKMWPDKIELVDCNSLGVEEMKKALLLPFWVPTKVVVRSSWHDGKLQTSVH